MKLSDSFKTQTVKIISYLYILLFVYASVSKLLDFKDFQIQLAQSPLLSAYAGTISIAVIFSEFILAGLLSFKRSRLLGLYGSFSIMIAFSIYIYLILNFSDFVPCSCGGVLEKLGWTEHLLFNLFFVLIGILAIFFTECKKNIKAWYTFSKISVCVIASVGMVILLFLSSEHIIKRENNFTRRFIPSAISEDKSFDLKYNSYYFAGYHSGEIFLGNVTAPLLLTRIDTALQKTTSQTIGLDNSNHKFMKIVMTVRYPFLYVSDGSVPVIYRSKLNDTIASTISFNDVYFSHLQPIDSVRFAFRAQSSKTKKNVLGTLKVQKKVIVNLNKDILKTKDDGIFDTDGQLLSDPFDNSIVYIHYYTNKILVMDSALNILHELTTIDTISKPQIEVSSSSGGKHQMAAPPSTVNKNSTVFKNLLFNESNLMGRYESKDLWQAASVIDVYRNDEQNYLGSFFVEHRGKNKLSQMMVTDQYLFVLSGNEIIRYRLAQAVVNNFK